jgi:hypothetical protein
MQPIDTAVHDREGTKVYYLTSAVGVISKRNDAPIGTHPSVHRLMVPSPTNLSPRLRPPFLAHVVIPHQLGPLVVETFLSQKVD